MNAAINVPAGVYNNSMTIASNDLAHWEVEICFDDDPNGTLSLDRLRMNRPLNHSRGLSRTAPMLVSTTSLAFEDSSQETIFNKISGIVTNKSKHYQQTRKVQTPFRFH
jgi:hypothetical protein